MIGLLGHLRIRRKAYGETGKQGLPGIIHRTSEWAAGIQYRNDSALTDAIRYIDIVVVTTGVNSFSVFRCKRTHTSSSSITTANTTYWEEMNSMYPIYTPLILADNAVFRFAQTNQLFVMKDDGVTVNLGMGGGDYPLWIGSPTPEAASFRVSFAGKLSATDADISGKITATSGKFGIFSIGKGSYDEGTLEASLARDSFGDTYAIKIQPNRFYIEGTNSIGHKEFVLIMPNLNSDKYDSEGLVWISGSARKIAVAISGGMIQGIRPYVRIVSYTSSYLQADTTILRGQTSPITINLQDSYLSEGSLFRIINDTQMSVTIRGTSATTIIDLINGAQDVNYCTIAPQEGSFNIVYDGTYAIVYKS